MIRILAILIGLTIFQMSANASELDTAEKSCLEKIHEEVDFILSGIDLVNQEFEKKLKEKNLKGFKNSNYSTEVFLDNSIRKYKNDIIGELKSYPANYKAVASKIRVKKPCLAVELQKESVPIIHKFEVTWEQTIKKAEKNHQFFMSVEHLKQ